MSLMMFVATWIINSKRFWNETFSLGTVGLGEFFIETKTRRETIKRIAAINMVVKTSCLSGLSAINGSKENQINPCSMAPSVD